MEAGRSYEQLESQLRLLQRKLVHLEVKAESYESENRFFEMMISSLPGIFYMFDENFQVHRWNRNVEKVTGYSSEEVTTRNLFDLFTGPDLSLVQDAIQQAFDTGEGSVEAILTTKDGRRIPYFFTGVTAGIGGVQYLLGMGQDISELKEAEAALRESELLYRLFAERMTEGVMLLHGYKILFVNQAFASMFGYEAPDELVGKEVINAVSAGLGREFRQMYDEVEKGREQEQTFQLHLETIHGKDIWIEGKANLIRWKGRPSVLLTAHDITEAKLREISIKEEADSLRRENVNLRSSIKERYRFGEIMGKSAAMQEVYEIILDAAASDANVIIYGESGTGKELVAGAIHKLSMRSENAFVPVNSAAIPGTLLESEFFGHKKGAFTGAHTDKKGYLDMADKGTLFLDEVGELSPGIQAKLLRAIESGEYSPVGSSKEKRSDFRIISATKCNLLEQVGGGLMREDFFFRVHIIPIYLPPLRHRKEDIPLLVEHFLRVYADDKQVTTLPGRDMEKLQEYEWPGNVRELRNVIHRYVSMRRLDFLPTGKMEPSVRKSAQKTGRPQPDMPVKDIMLKNNVNEVEKRVIAEALEKYRWNKSRAAEALGITRKTLSRKIRRLGL